MNFQENINELESELKILQEKFPTTKVVEKMNIIKATIHSMSLLQEINNPKAKTEPSIIAFDKSNGIVTITSENQGKEKVEELKSFIMITKNVSADWYSHRPIKQKTMKQDWMSVNYTIDAYVRGVIVVSYKTGIRENFNHFIKALVREFPLVTSNVFEIKDLDVVIYLNESTNT